MAFDDDSSGDSGQFQINRNLQSGQTYILVVTTFSIGVTGSFSLRVNGPASVYLSLITPTTPPTSTPTRE